MAALDFPGCGNGHTHKARKICNNQCYIFIYCKAWVSRLSPSPPSWKFGRVPGGPAHSSSFAGRRGAGPWPVGWGTPGCLELCGGACSVLVFALLPLLQGVNSCVANMTGFSLWRVGRDYLVPLPAGFRLSLSPRGYLFVQRIQ